MPSFLEKIRNQYDNITKVLLLAFSVAVIVMLLPKEQRFKYEFQKGKPWLHADLIAPFDFPIYKTKDAIEADRQALLDELKPYFRYDRDRTQKLRKEVSDRFRESWTGRYGPEDILIPERLRNFEFVLTVFDTLFETGVIELAPMIEGKPEDSELILIDGNIATEKELKDFFKVQEAFEFIQGSLSGRPLIDSVLVTGILTDVLTHNVLFDEQKTETAVSTLLADLSITQGMVQKGERIISRGELVTEEKFRILSSLRDHYESRPGSMYSYYFILGGQIIMVTASILILLFFIFLFRKTILSSNKNLILILSLIILLVLMVSWTVKFDPYYIYLVPVCLVPIIIRAFYDARLALYIHLTTILLTGFLVPNSYQYVLLQLMAGIVAIAGVYNLQKRSQFILTALYVFLTYSTIYVAKTLIEDGSLDQIDTYHFLLFGGNAILILFAYPLIFLIEKLYGMITDITLIELNNTNNKLLRDLAVKAPGTFQHSLQVANLAEEVIFDIGGNSLLVRTGALYHDIGKMDNPMYYIENQTTGVNPHDELTYEESARIIISHVIKGVEKAKKHNLPEEIIDFIRTHHGTRKVDFFYIKQKQDFPGEDIDDMIFTYPGPIPFSRETAVLMMADSVEAASRSLHKPTEETLNNLVDNIINKQVDTGQFINSDITLRDISRSRKILKKMLQNIYHIRIEYPE